MMLNAYFTTYSENIYNVYPALSQDRMSTIRSYFAWAPSVFLVGLLAR